MTENLPVELKAMAQLESVLKDLTDEERARVMQWVSARFGSNLKRNGGNVADAHDTTSDEVYADLPTFYAAARPKTDAERALVVAYWLQYRENVADVET